MIPLLVSISYALGVLSIVLAGEWERRKGERRHLPLKTTLDYIRADRPLPLHIVIGGHFSQDSTLPSESK